jgi:hypothetical protein
MTFMDAGMDDEHYQVVLTGELLTTVSQRQAVSEFAHLFGISQGKAADLFREAPCTVRGRLSHEQAIKYQRVLHRKGILSEVSRDTSPVASSLPIALHRS